MTSLAEQYLPGARKMAEWHGRYLSEDDKEDMVASAYLGLVEAERSGKWDVSRSSFYTFAKWYMRSAFRTWTDLGRKLAGPRSAHGQMLRRTTTMSDEGWTMIESRLVDGGIPLEDALERAGTEVLHLTVYKDGKRSYWVGSDNIPGCFGVGGTIVGALESMTETIRQHTAGA